MEDWQTLKNRYSTSKAYKHRKVINNHLDFEDFQDYLVNACGAEVLAVPKQDEALRFKMPDKNIGIIYGKGSGNLIAHNLGMRYCMDNGIDLPPDYHNQHSNYLWTVPVKNPNHGLPNNGEPEQTYEYCFGCKEIQPLLGDQCAICYCYIKF